MNRYARSLIVVWVGLVAVMSFGCKSQGDSQRKRSSVVSCNLSSTERSAASDVQVHIVSCGTNTACPKGTRCVLDPGSNQGHCDWDCLADTDCGMTGVCTCDGICSDNLPPGVTSPDNAICPRNATRMSAAKDTDPCRFDTDCPYGMFCGPAGLCTFNCSDPTPACTATGEACDCYGRCVTAGTPDQRPRTRLPSMSFDPPDFTIPGSTGGSASWTRTTRVTLQTRDTDLLVGTGATRTFISPVTVYAGSNLQVACVADTFTDKCTITGGSAAGWTFKQTGDLWVARQVVWVRRNTSTGAPGPTGPTDSWQVRASSSLAAPSPVMLQVGFDPTGGAAPSWVTTPSVTTPILYTGSLVVRSPATLTANSPNVHPPHLRIPIMAALNPTCSLGTPCLVLDDPTRVLSPNEAIVLQLDGTPQKIDWIVPSAGTNQTGSVPATFTSVTYSRQNVSGRVQGTVAVRAELDGQTDPSLQYNLEYDLTPERGKTTCDANTACATGTTCIRGLCTTPVCATNADCSGAMCVEGLCAGNRSTISGNVVPTLQNETFMSWAAASSNIVQRLASATKVVGNRLSTMWFDDLFDHLTGVAAPGGTPSNYLVDPGKYFDTTFDPEFALSVCNDGFDNYVLDLETLMSSVGFTNVSVTGGGVSWIPGSMYNSPTAVCNPAFLPAGGIPCIGKASFPLQPNHVLDYSGELSRIDFCEDIFANIKAADHLPSTANMSDYCQVAPKGNVFHLEDGVISEDHQIFFCRSWSDVFAAPMTGRTVIDRKLMFRQDVSGPGGPLHSRALALAPSCQAQLFSAGSGDAVGCGSERPMGGITLLSQSDSVSQTQTKSASDLLAACIADLKKQPPDFSRHKFAVNDAATLSDIGTFFDPGQCLGSAQFYSAVIAARDAASNDPSDVDVQRLRLRILQQWAELHSFLAQQGLEVDKLARTDAASSALANQFNTPITTSPTNLDELLQMMEEGWTLIVQAAIQDRTFNASTAVLRAPDYRPASARDTDPDQRRRVFVGTPNLDTDYEQPYGLASALMEGLVSHMKLLSEQMRTIAQQNFQGKGSNNNSKAAQGAMDRFGAAMRLAFTIEEISTRMYDKAFGTPVDCTKDTEATACAEFDPPSCNLDTKHCEPSTWAGRWGQAREAYLQARTDAFSAAAELRGGQNPLGIDEDDLPLFFGDLTGTNSRFFASSDYLMNTWAISAVQTARSALTDARDAWIKQRDSKISDQQNANEADRRLDAILDQYGNQIASACGLSNLTSADAFNKLANGDISLNSCFIQGVQACQPPPIDPVQAQNDANYNMAFDACMKQQDQFNWENLVAQEEPCYKYYEHFPDKSVGPLQIILPSYEMKDRSTGNCSGEFLDASSTLGSTWHPCLGDCSGIIISTCSYTQVARQDCSYDDYAKTKIKIFDSTLPDNMTQKEYCEETAGRTAARNIVEPAIPLSCYQGDLGASATKIIAAVQDVQLATIAWQDIQNQYYIQGKACAHKAKANDIALMADKAFEATMRDYIDARHEAQIEGDILGVMTGGVNAGVSTGMAAGPVAGIAAGVFTTFTGAAQASISNQINKINDAMELASIDHESFMRDWQHEEELYTCMVDAEKIRVGFDAIRNTIVRRATDVGAALNEAHDLLNKTARALDDGRAAVSREKGRTVGTYSFHYWYDEKVQRYNREFDWAKRLTYLTLRAIEYEFQQSFPLRRPILTANHPDELEAALQEMQTELATRTINRRRPEQASIVLSLRDDVLGVQDRSSATNGDRALTPAMTFRSRLWDDKFAIRDTNGKWMGQGIPFVLSPQGALVNRCAERMWRVTATVQGDGLSDTEPGAPVILLKRNTFSSQWCEGRGADGDTTMQVGAIQPSRNLFRGDSSAMPDQAQAFSAASIYPWFNIRRSDFYKASYQDGSSEELAGRGLYGDYILLFPSTLLEGSHTVDPAPGDTGMGPQTAAFPLNKVEDVLLRFDYLSVDNLPAVGN